MSRPKRVAVVGTGPAGFFAADALLQGEIPVEVDLIDRLPVPFGLIRYGIAPDHPRIKNVAKVFERLLDRPEVAFFGNVDLGRTVSIGELREWYDAVVIAVGMDGHRALGVPGESLDGSWTAPEIVGWYNGHPDYANVRPDLSGETAVVVGNGHVALDVARMLARDPGSLHETTDVPGTVLSQLRNSNIKKVVLLGRRGPAQNAFGLGDLKEVGDIPGCTPTVRPDDLLLAPEDEEELAAEGRTLMQRNFDLLKGYADNVVVDGNCELSFRFLESPVEIIGDDAVTGVRVVQNELVGVPGSRRAVATDHTEVLPCSLLVRCIGYRGTAIDGLPFDERETIVPNVDGRVIEASGGAVIPGLYAVGWARRGPVGLIGVNKKDSTAVAQLILADLAAIPATPPVLSRQEVFRLVAERIDVTSTDDWRKIDQAEVEAGAATGRPREKLLRAEDMLKFRG